MESFILKMDKLLIKEIGKMMSFAESAEYLTTGLKNFLVLLIIMTSQASDKSGFIMKETSKTTQNMEKEKFDLLTEKSSRGTLCSIQ